MEPKSSDARTSDQQAVDHLAEAHTLLQSLRSEINEHPNLEGAIQKLEMALSILTTKTGGML